VATTTPEWEPFETKYALPLSGGQNLETESFSSEKKQQQKQNKNGNLPLTVLV
jgi:hypothetical protein